MVERKGIKILGVSYNLEIGYYTYNSLPEKYKSLIGYTILGEFNTKIDKKSIENLGFDVNFDVKVPNDERGIYCVLIPALPKRCDFSKGSLG
jgi:hypothetical protein